MDDCCSPVEKGWAWAVPALRRQGEKERATTEKQWRGEIIPVAVKKWRPVWKKLGGGGRR
jgi:hypothetical protein